MTNGGMVTEQTKANKLNELFELTPGLMLTTDHINLCHTVLQSDALKQYRDKYVLVDSNYNAIELALSYGFHKAVTLGEMLALYPEICPGHGVQDAKKVK